MNDVTAKVVNLGQPFTKGIYARNVWDMLLFDGKIYLAHGNSSNFGPSPNAGPVPVIYLDPASGNFKTLFTADDEQISVLKVYGDVLYLPGNDAREEWDFGNFYTVIKNGGYQKCRTTPNAIHVVDLAVYGGKLYSANKSSASGRGEVMSGELKGYPWDTQMPSSLWAKFGSAAHTLFEFKGYLYAASEFAFALAQYHSLLVMDGTKSWVQQVTGNGFMPGYSKYYLYKMLRPLVFNDKLVYLGVRNNNALQWLPEFLFAATEINQASRINLGIGVLPTDILVREGTLYVLAYIKVSSTQYTNIVYQTTNLTTWTELFRFTADTFARSFEEYSGNFYFGLGCNTDVLPASTGSILKVPTV